MMQVQLSESWLPLNKSVGFLRCGTTYVLGSISCEKGSTTVKDNGPPLFLSSILDIPKDKTIRAAGSNDRETQQHAHLLLSFHCRRAKAMPNHHGRFINLWCLIYFGERRKQSMKRAPYLRVSFSIHAESQRRLILVNKRRMLEEGWDSNHFIPVETRAQHDTGFRRP
mmetsp:Transcript_3742/g.8354  ORF Transcript_3742/g.8354 Transcript_3742/m.8354 type:complete len:168 (+) Transcript_3742:1558-2061(+)